MTTDTFPLAVSQLGIWVGHHADVESSSAFHGVLSWRIISRIDLDALVTAFDRFVRRHAGARTTFHLGPDGPFQRVASEPPRRLEIKAVSARYAQLHDEIVTEVRKPFDLARGPLRAVAYVSAPDDVIVTFVAHHIGWDLLSTDLLLEELPRLYLEALDGTPANLPVVTRGFDEFVRGESAFLASPEGEASAAAWQALLAGAPTSTNLPLDRPRLPVRRARGASFVQTFEPAIVEGLRPLGKSMLRTLLGAFAVTLWRYTGDREIVIGTAADNRPSPNYVGVTGNFITMLPLRIALDPSWTVERLLAAIHETVRGASAHRRFPFGRIVDRVRPPRDASITPIIQTAMGLHGLPKHPALSALMIPGAQWKAQIGPWTSEAYALPQHEGQLDLELVCALEDGALHAELKYHPDLFERATIERMGESLRAVVQAFAANPRVVLSDIEVVPSRDLDAHAGLAGPAVPVSALVHTLFDAAAARVPERMALTGGDVRWTYGELASLTNRCAQTLIARGIGRGQRVGIVAHRVPATVALMLAVMKTGAAYVPLAPDWPEDRTRAVEHDADLRVVLVAGDLDALVAEGTNDASPNVRVEPEDPIYVLYTSGSTGAPKGVVVPHRGITNTTLWLQREIGITDRDHVSQAVALSFDGSVCELWPTLTAGASLHLVDDDTRLSPSALARWLEREQITVAVLPTPLASALLREAAQPRSLRVLLIGGDVLHAPPTPPPYEVVNLYGPTEYSVNTTFARVRFDADHAPPIGRPIANTSVYVLDHDRRVPVGAPGELCVGGAGLALGYLGRPDLTAERFVPNPISAEPATIYRTGDLVRLRADGVLEFLGRIDQQVKVRGFRVELGEVEAALLSNPNIADACVVAEAHRLIAYVVPRELDATEVRAALRRVVPEYMVPSAYVALPALPRTRNGKIDRAALPAPSEERTRVRVAPANDAERRLHELWVKVLGTDDIGVTDDFFDLGGSSLHAVHLSVLVEQELGRSLPVLTNARRASVREQAGLLEQAAGSEVRVLAGDAKRATLLVHPLSPGEPYSSLQQAAPRPMRLVSVRHSGMARSSIEAIASAHQRALALKGETFERIAGWSFGGLIGFELAQQIARDTGVSPDVFLFDTLAPGVTIPRDEAALEAWFRADAGDLPEGEAARMAYRVFRETIACFEAYAPSGPYGGRVVLVRARDVGGDWVSPSRDGGWTRWAPRLEIIEVAGDHHSIMQPPHVSALATHLFES